MSTITLDSDMLYNFNIVASDESLRERLARYLRKLVRERDNDPTCMTKEEALRIQEEGIAQFERGECYEQLPGESFYDMLNRYRADYHV